MIPSIDVTSKMGSCKGGKNKWEKGLLKFNSVILILSHRNSGYKTARNRVFHVDLEQVLLVPLIA